jgi:hypothetical protein
LHFPPRFAASAILRDNGNPEGGRLCMSDNGQLREIPLGERFSVRGHEFVLDVRDAYFAFEDIRRALPPDATNKDYLLAVGKWIEEKIGPAVDMTLGELDWFSDEIAVLYNAKKKARNDSIASMWTSSSSTP